MAALIIDTGPLVALFDRRSSAHAWVKDALEGHQSPARTCQAVVAETLFLMRRDGLDPNWLLEYHRRGALVTHFDLDREIDPIQALIVKYDDLPMSLADACLVRMSEIHKDPVVCTLDRDFLVYRRNGRQKIPLLAPFA
jgi:predicted nucleic acid-binding protein